MEQPAKTPIDWKVILKKMLVCLVGMFITGVGVVFYLRAKIGLDPISVWTNGLSKLLGLEFGWASFVNSMFFLAVALVIARRNIGIGTVFLAVCGGPIIDVVERAMNSFVPPDGVYTLPQQVAMLIGGVLFLCLGLAFVVSVRFGFNPNDAVLFKICEWTRIQYRWIKITADWTLALIGWLIGGEIGIGTIVGAFAFGPLITEFVKLYNKTVLRLLGLQDERNEFKKMPKAPPAAPPTTPPAEGEGAPGPEKQAPAQGE